MTRPVADPRVFLSHTSELAEYPTKDKSYVTAALDAVREVGLVGRDMRDFAAASTTPANLDALELQDCQIYLGLLGFRYGMEVRDEPGVSYTQQEFRTARAAGKTLLVFLLHEDAVGPGSLFRDENYGTAQVAFRNEVLNLEGAGLVCQFFKTADELQRLVVRALQYALRPVPALETTEESARAVYEEVLRQHGDGQLSAWNARIAAKRDYEDRLEHYVEPHYALWQEEPTERERERERGEADKSGRGVGIVDEQSAGRFELVAQAGDSAEQELLRLLSSSARLCLAEDAGAGKSVFTQRAVAFACSEPGRAGLFGGRPGLVVRWEQWEHDWPTDFHRALTDVIRDSCTGQTVEVRPEALVDWVLVEGRVLLILDGLDQVNNSTVIAGVSMFLKGPGRKCRAIVTGRSYKVDQSRQTLLKGREWRFARIEGFDDEQIREYLTGFDVDRIFPDREGVAELIRIPSVLRIVREVLETDRTIQAFHTRADLYRQASHSLIFAAGTKLDANFDEVDVRRVEQILAATAFEMMCRRCYGYAVRGRDLVEQVERGAARRCLGGIGPQEWRLIRNVTGFTNHCIFEGIQQTMLSWQHRGMMEFYSGLHLACYASPGCREDSQRFAGDGDWFWAWRFAIEMPAGAVESEVQAGSLANLYRVQTGVRRPTELMYRAWGVMEGTTEGRAALVGFRGEYSALREQGHPVAEEIERGFVRCPPDLQRDSLTYLMGAAETDDMAYADEKPQQEKTVAPFLLGQAPVTKRQFALFDAAYATDAEIRDRISEFSPEDECPAICVSWYDAWCCAAWCGSRLPTEVEWEYACRAGTQSRYWWGHEMDASKCTYGARKTTVADPAHANAWGLMEMLGNVYEWCDTWVCEDSEGASEDQQGTSRVLRGGSGNYYNPGYLRSTYRNDLAPGLRYNLVGFRFSRTP